MSKLVALIFLYVLVFIVGFLTLMFGWGLHVQSWSALILGWIGQSIIIIVIALIKDE